MKLFYKISVLSLISFLFCGKIIAQTPDTAGVSDNYFKPFSMDKIFKTWSVGVNTGIITYSNIFDRNKNLDFTSPSTKIAYGLYVKKQIMPILGIEGQVFTGNLGGANSQQTTNGDPDYLSSSTSLKYAASINVVLNFANLNWHYNNMGVQPFLGVGFGLMNYHPKVTTIDATGTSFITTDLGSANNTFIPAQIGLKLNISRDINLDLAYQVNFALSDNVDGNTYGSSNDRFSYLNIGLEFALGKRSKRQMATYGTVPMRYAHVAVKKNKINASKAAVDTVKVTSVEVKPNHNEFDRRFKALSMDSDSDGVSDYFDKCPNTPQGVVVDDSGCPILEANHKVKVALTEREKQIIADASKSIEFEKGKAVLGKTAQQSLDQLLGLLIEKKMDTNFPVQILIISGHADDFSSDLSNLSLSHDRAEAIKTYLVKKGIKTSNLITVGYGNEKPADGSAKGKSRKVEFTLY
jgi:OmpA-OmpF porin, OOP family